MKLKEINEKLQILKTINEPIENIEFALGLVEIEDILQKESDKGQKAIQKTAMLTEEETAYYNDFFVKGERTQDDNSLFQSVHSKLVKANEIMEKEIKLSYNKLNKAECPKGLTMEQYRALGVFFN